jgi:hypothetical protein
VLGQHLDVLAALAQRRHGDRDDLEPVEEILAEALLAHELAELLVGGGHDAHVDAHGPGAPQPLELALLQHAEDLRLGHQRERFVSDGDPATVTIPAARRDRLRSPLPGDLRVRA